MKNNCIIIIGILLCINSCRMPSNPLGEIKIIKRFETIATGYECLDIDVSDSILVAAANYNGFFIYELNKSNSLLDSLTIKEHGTEMYDNTWNNRAQEVHLSEKHGLVFIVDYYDKIWIYKLNGQQFISENNYDFAYVNDCSNGVWLSSTIDESHDDYVRIFSLVKHNATSVQSGEGMGYEDYLGNSTSIVWRNIDPSATEITNENNEIYCEYTMNLGSDVSNIYFSDSLLTIANGELGVVVLKQLNGHQCFNDSTHILIDSFYDNICEGDSLWSADKMVGNGIFDVGESFLDCITVCENDTSNWKDGMGNNEWDPGEIFKDCHSLYYEADANLLGCNICSDHDGWESYMGDGYKNQNAEEFIDCGRICQGSEYWDDTWTDALRNGIWDGADEFVDCDTLKNGVFDPGLDYFTDCSADDLDVCECSLDWNSDGDGVWDEGDGIWTPAEELITDYNENGVWNPAEEYLDDNGDGEWTPAECFMDLDGDGEFCADEESCGSEEGLWFVAEMLVECDTNADSTWTPAEELITDYNGNGLWDPAEEYSDDDEDEEWDPAEEFTEREIICSNDERWEADKGDNVGDDLLGRFGALDTLTIDNNENGIFDEAEPLLDCREIGLDYSKDKQYCKSLDGIYEPSGGFHPSIFSEFTGIQGSVNTTYNKDNTLFIGLSNSNGIYIVTLNETGEVVSSFQFAIGYNIKGIHEENGLLALAAGHDGILLYDWNGNDVSFIGKIETGESHDVQVASNIIFAATEYGIEIIQIDITP